MASSHPGPRSLSNDCALLREYERDGDDSDSSFDDGSPLLGGSLKDDINDRSQLVPNGAKPIHSDYGSTFREHEFSAPAHTAANENSALVHARALEDCIDDDDEVPTGKWDPWWKEARVLAAYTVPVATTHILEYSLVVTSVISLGHLSTAALAASTLGSMTANVTGLSVIQGFVSALDSVLPQAWTSGEPRLVGLWAQRMTVIVAITLVPILVIWQMAEEILLLLKQDPEVARLAGVYLRWLSFSLPAYGFNSISRRYFQCQGHLNIPSVIIAIVAPINMLLNYLLVWGPPSIRLGYIGAPIATAISFNIIAIVSLIMAVFWIPHTAWHPITWKSVREPGAGKGLAWLTWIGIAGVGQTALDWWSWELVGLAASFLGPASLAAQSVLLVSASIIYQAPYALSVATSVRVGNLLGARQAQEASIACKVSLVMALCMAFFTTSSLVVLRKKWGYIFNSDIEVVTLVASLLPITALTQLFDAIIAVSAGILRARGKQVLGAFLNLTAFYVIGIPFGILFAFKLHLQLLGLWLGLCTALVYAAAASLWFVLRTDWEKEVERTRERLGGFGDDDEGATRSPVIRARRRTMSNGGGRV